MKEKLIKWLERERWYPMHHCTDIEFKTSEFLNQIIDDMISRLKKLK